MFGGFFSVLQCSVESGRLCDQGHICLSAAWQEKGAVTYCQTRAKDGFPSGVAVVPTAVPPDAICAPVALVDSAPQP